MNSLKADTSLKFSLEYWFIEEKLHILCTRKLADTYRSPSQGSFSGHEGDLQRRWFPPALDLELCDPRERQISSIALFECFS